MSGDIERLQALSQASVRDVFNADLLIRLNNDLQLLQDSKGARSVDDVTLEVKYLVRADGGSLPQAESALRYFRTRNSPHDVRVEDTGNALQVTMRGSWRVLLRGFDLYPDILWPAQEKTHNVGGQRVLVDLILPDVYGCQVTVTQDQVQIHVGQGVIDRITRDEQQRKGFLASLLYQPGSLINGAVSVHYASSGFIVLTRMHSQTHECKWLWELIFINKLIKTLSPFREYLPTDPLPVKDRCFVRKPAMNVSSPNTHDGHTDVVMKLTQEQCSVVSRRRCFIRTCSQRPGLYLSCDTDQRTLTLSGAQCDVEKAAQDMLSYISSLSCETFPVCTEVLMLLQKHDAQTEFQQSLDSKGIDCDWKLYRVPLGRNQNSLTESSGPEVQTVISVTAARSDFERFQQTFWSCFQSADVILGNNMKPHLRSESWKQFQNNLQRPYENMVTPVLKVDEDRIKIYDMASSLDATRKTVCDFFHGCVMREHSEFYEQIETKSIIGLHPWSMSYLLMAQSRKQLPEFLQHPSSVNADNNTVCICAPRHMLETQVCSFWQYVANLSHYSVELTEACAHVLQTPDRKERVQALLDQQGVCHWHVDQARLFFTAQHSHIQHMKDIIMSEIETIRRTLESHILHQKNRGLLTEGTTARSGKQQQADIPHQQSKERMIDTVATDNQQAQPEITTQMEDGHIDESSSLAGGQVAKTHLNYQRFKELQTPSTKATTLTPRVEIGKQQTLDDSTNYEKQNTHGRRSMDRTMSTHSIQNRHVKKNMVAYCSTALSTSAVIAEAEVRKASTQAQDPHTGSTETPTTWTHSQAKVEAKDAYGDTSRQGERPNRSGLSPWRTIQHTACKQTGHGLDLQKSKQSSVNMTEGSTDELQPVQIPEERSSSTFPKSPVASQGDRTEDPVMNRTSTHDLCSPQHPSPVTKRYCQHLQHNRTQQGAFRQSNSSTFSPESQEGVATAQLGPDPAPQWPGSSSGPGSTTTSAPRRGKNLTGRQTSTTTGLQPSCVRHQGLASGSVRWQTPWSCTLPDCVEPTFRHTIPSPAGTWSGSQGTCTASGVRGLQSHQGIEEASLYELSTTSADLESIIRRRCLQLRRPRQHRDNLDSELLTYLLTRVTQLEGRLKEREKSRERQGNSQESLLHLVQRIQTLEKSLLRNNDEDSECLMICNNSESLSSECSSSDSK